MADKDGRYVFRRCMPTDEVTIVNVTPGEILERTFNFVVNAPVELQQRLKDNEIDPRTILHGADGKLFDEDGRFLAEVNQFEATMSVTTAEYQGAGQMQKWGITTAYMVNLTFTETVVHDNMLFKILQGLQTGRSMPELIFTAKLDGADL